MSHQRTIGRRSLLQALGAAIAASPFVGRRTSEAAPSASAVPQNLVLVTWPEGLETGWQPRTFGPVLSLSPMLAAFEAVKDQMVFCNGLQSGYGLFDSLTAHTSGPLSLWTGMAATGNGGLKELAAGPSIDQIFARTADAASRPFASLHFGAQTNGPSFISVPYVHYAGDRQPISAEDNPASMFDQIFGVLADKDPGAIAALRARRKSVLDFVTGELAAVGPRIAASDRPKIDQHLASVRALEKNLDAIGACAAPSAPATAGAAALLDANFPAVIKAQIDLLVAALGCGVTRVATLQLTNTDSGVRIPGIATTRGVHEAQHSGSYDDRVAIATFFLTQMAALVAALRAVPLGDGTTLLDKTLVVMGSDLAVGSHAPDPAAFLLAGGGGQVIPLGRYLDFASTKPRHTQLLTSVLQAMQVPNISAVGNLSGDLATGPLPGLLA